MKRIIKYLAFIGLVFWLVAGFVVLSHGQTKRRTKKPFVLKRKPQTTRVKVNPTPDKILTDCLALSNKPKPDIYYRSSKTKQKFIVSDCEPMNLKQLNQPKPLYPKAAKAVGASGLVKIDAVFDEAGKVIWAKVTEGHPLLRAEALRAACSTRIQSAVNCFGRRTKVNVIFTYNFTLD
jgi:outer membrane biosynthesis protein TonB